MMLQRFTGTGIAWILPLILGGSLPYAQFTTGVSLVEVYATVVDRQGVPVTDLKANDFRVMQDGVPQTITVFAAGEFPLAVAIGVDRSFSMAGKSDRLAVAKSAARAFIGALRKDDQVMVVAIGTDTEVAAPLSTDHAAALAAMRGGRRRCTTRRWSGSMRFSLRKDVVRSCCCRTAPTGTAKPARPSS